uniref:Stereocilin n=1 Tax=Geotrypetes seraphini TaxID=260995 RepID=A0A6P8NKV2_GEOSA|nr:stereocilin [Geotrypetes seraphini]
MARRASSLRIADTIKMALVLILFWFLLLVKPLSNTGHNTKVNPYHFKEIISIWKSRIGKNTSASVLSKFQGGLKQQNDIQTLLKNVVAGLQSLKILIRERSTIPVGWKDKESQNHLSEFLFNISIYLQNEEPQEKVETSWENFLNQLFPVQAEKFPSSQDVRLQDILVSLRGSQNWDTIFSFFQHILKLFSKEQMAVHFMRQNWEILSSMVDTLLQFILSRTLGQASTTLQGVLCSLMGHNNCSLNTDWLQLLLTLFEGTNWKPVFQLQSRRSTLSEERLKPFNILPVVFKDKRHNFTHLNLGQSPTDMQSLFQILYRSKERGQGMASVGSVGGSENKVWKALDEIQHSFLRRVGRSVYDNFNKKISHMRSSLLNKVSSVIGMPYSDQEGRCSVGSLQQLLLWGIKHDIRWNVQTLGFNSKSFSSSYPITSCQKTGDVNITEERSHSISKRSDAETWEDPWFSADVLEAACNDTIPGLPGVSNFTVYLYCNLFNSTDYTNYPAPDLKVTCSDAAWYLLSVEEDSIWVRVCSEYFPAEFNVAVCQNSSFIGNDSHNQLLMEELCKNLSSDTEMYKDPKISSTCLESLDDVHFTQDNFWSCFLENRTFWMERLCRNMAVKKFVNQNKTWLSKLCQRYELNSYIVNLTILRAISSCNYKAWNSNAFSNSSLLEQCRGIDKNMVCNNSSFYKTLVHSQPWIVDYCSDTSKDEKCILQRFVDMLPVSANFDSSQLCKSPISYLMGVASQIAQCDDESPRWLLNVSYLLKLMDSILTFSSLDAVGEEAREQLAEAMLLSSLLDNASFWASFEVNSSQSILQTVGWYLGQEHNHSKKKDLLSCFSPVLWGLVQDEENATDLEVLLQEYLHMPPEDFQKLLMSAENDAVKQFLSLMHRTWHRLKVSKSDERALETLTSLLIQKFPRLTPQLFVDLSQFIPFMSISDIVSFPPSLLANDSVLAAIRSQSQDMKFTQKRAFAKRLLQANGFGDVPSWPSYFLKSIQPLLPHLPLCHFMQLTPEQIRLLADGWKNVHLGVVQGRYVAQSFMNRSEIITEEQIRRLGYLTCFLSYEDLQNLFPLRDPFGLVVKKLSECIADGTLNPHGRLAYSLVNFLQTMNVTAFGSRELRAWRGLLPELGVRFLQRLSDTQVRAILPELQPADLTPAQVAETVICNFHSLLSGLSPEFLQSLPVSALTNMCQCLPAVLSHLSSTQKATILRTLRAQKLIGQQCPWSPQLICLLPFVPLKLLPLDPQNLLVNISQYSEIPWAPQQAQLLWQKIRVSRNVTKDMVLQLGTLAAGIDCDTLQQWTSLSDFLKVVKHLYEFQNKLPRSLRKCILENLQRRSGLLGENLSWFGPEFITDLPVKLIPRLSNESMKQLLEHVSRNPRSFLELPSHKRVSLARGALLALRVPGAAEITGEVLDLLGPMVGFLEEESLAQLSKESLRLHLEELKMFCLPEEFTELLGRLLTEDDVLGNPAHWTLKDLEQAGRLIFYLTTETLYTLPQDVLSRECLEWLLESQRSWEESAMGQICAQRRSSGQERMKIKKRILVSPIVKRKGNQEIIPSCADIRVTFPAAWSASQVMGITLADFEDCLLLISQDRDLSTEQVKAALTKAKQLFGPVRTMNQVQILQLGHLTSQLSEKELQELPPMDWGVISMLGSMESWTPKQMRAAVRNILRQNRKGTPDLDLVDLTALGHFLCGLRVEEIQRINKQEFSQAAVFLGSLKLRCTEAQMEALANLLTSSSAFDEVSGWGSEIFTEVGTLAAGLPDIVLSSLVPIQIQGLTPEAISLITAPKFAVVFTPAQLVTFTTDQAAAVTPEQYEQLSPQQRQAVSSALYEGEFGQDLRGENNAGTQVLPTPFAYHLMLLLGLVHCMV